MTTTDIHALAGAYVLDAVDDVERMAFSRHLAECETCRVEVEEMREVAARLADPTWSVPPPRMRTDVMAAIGRTRQLGPGASEPPVRDVSAVVSRWRRFTAGAAAAGIMAVGAGAATYAIQEQRVDEARTSASAAAASQARMQAILGAPDVVFRTEAMTGGGQVTVASSTAQRAGVVWLAARTAPERDKAFQFWTIVGNAPAPRDVLPAGTGTDVRVVENLPAAATFAVTVEPEGGSTAPTLPPVAKVPLI
jgi:anti-sigma-K factor RskA